MKNAQKTKMTNSCGPM